jgi:hypothetical protein
MHRFWSLARTTSFVAYGGIVFALISFIVSYALVFFAPESLSSYKFVFDYAALPMVLVWNTLGSVLAAYIHDRATVKYLLELKEHPDEIDFSKYEIELWK